MRRASSQKSEGPWTILQIIPALDAGGAERTTVDVSTHIVSIGGRSLVASRGGRLVSELEEQGGVWVPFAAHTKNPVRMAAQVASLVRLCRVQGVNLIHARSRAPAWTAFFAARILKIPFVTTYHGIYNGSSRFKIFYNSIMARGHRVIANSAYTASFVKSQYPFAESAIRTIPRGTDFRLFSPDSVSKERIQRLWEAWGVDPSLRLILVPARLTSWKGHRIVIDAAQRLRDRGLMNSVQIVFAGDAQGRTAYVAELEGRIRRAGLEGVVRLVGHCSDMPAALKAAYGVVVASVEPEAFGRVAVEAQAMGKPLIVSDLGAVSETVYASPYGAKNEATGWKVPPGDPDRLADALSDILALSEEEKETLAHRARAHVEYAFSVDRMVEKTLDVYCELLAPFAERLIQPNIRQNAAM